MVKVPENHSSNLPFTKASSGFAIGIGIVFFNESSVEKGIEYLVNELSNPTFINNTKLLQGFFMPIKALESYLAVRWGKHYNVEKELLDLKYAKLDEAKFSDLLSKVYVSSAKDYISQVVFGE